MKLLLYFLWSIKKSQPFFDLADLKFYSISSFPRLTSMKRQKNRSQKRPFFCPIFSSIFRQKPLYLVVEPLYFPFKPQFRIIITDSTCGERCLLYYIAKGSTLCFVIEYLIWNFTFLTPFDDFFTPLGQNFTPLNYFTHSSSPTK